MPEMWKSFIIWVGLEWGLKGIDSIKSIMRINYLIEIFIKNNDLAQGDAILRFRVLALLFN
ncbi:hypothetical protein [Pseudoalteromonas sp. T1lg23B]|uniref:hypothetical protein n=1 Tax=Pseudoalteromonas sp. T1lg23B TaxID=2077097 RepID=UPI001319F87A|nr:hypothetical protein [Pseudoalteromonas sp. T1lg23B]